MVVWVSGHWCQAVDWLAYIQPSLRCSSKPHLQEHETEKITWLWIALSGTFPSVAIKRSLACGPRNNFDIYKDRHINVLVSQYVIIWCYHCVNCLLHGLFCLCRSGQTGERDQLDQRENRHECWSKICCFLVISLTNLDKVKSTDKGSK